MHSKILFLGLSILTGALAAHETVSMYIPGGGEAGFNGTVVGEVIGSQSSTTTYLITCVDDDCDIPGGTLIEAPGTVTMLASDDTISYTGSIVCTHDDKKATCSGGAVGDDVETETEDVTSYAVTVTATETGSSSTPAAASASSTSTLATSTSGSTANSTSSGASAQQTDDKDNDAMSQCAGARMGAALVAVGAAAFAML
ncbi:hypothetical protein BJY01DRAFT_229444 [Aspergillus pseudoustus]|uniref:GPI anchored protein n=1 Tax=Aspergillus pseudoustus TaxID=1810923 RepID=A0ABR4IGP5_9EURO